MFYSFIKHLLFAQNAEKTHDLSLKWLKLAHMAGITRLFPKPGDVPCRVLGLDFKNPLGLAAGFDKNGDYIDALATLGFGFIELGTVTPRPQPGNPPPRIFRLPEYQAVINRMGFNNRGIDYLVSKIKKASFSGIIGVNIGKNLTTHVDHAYKDYLYCLQIAYPYAGYVTINISSPNTPGLRKLQTKAYLETLLNIIKDERNRLFQKYHRYVPILVKIAPDLNDDELSFFTAIFKQSHLDGIIATNTTLSREGIETSGLACEPGGLSGAPLRDRAVLMLNKLKHLLDEKTTLIASGGIMTSQDAVDRIQAGASLVQFYTGLIYSGPGIVHKTLRKIGEYYPNL